MADKVTVRYVNDESNHAASPDVIDLGNGVTLTRDGASVEIDAADYERIAGRSFDGARVEVVKGKIVAAEIEKKAIENQPPPPNAGPRELNPLG